MRWKWLNPFRFEKRFLLWSVWGNVLLAAVLLVLVGLMALDWEPKLWKAGYPRSGLSRQLDSNWNVVKLRKVILSEDYYIHRFLRDFARVSNDFAFLISAVVAMLLLNALYLYRAHRLSKSDAKV